MRLCFHILILAFAVIVQASQVSMWSPTFTLKGTLDTLTTGVHDFQNTQGPLELIVTPTPFNPTTRIQLRNIDAKKATQMAIYNVNGQRVCDFSKEIAKNITEIVWAPQSITSGVYVVRLVSGRNAINKKIVYMK